MDKIERLSEVNNYISAMENKLKLMQKLKSEIMREISEEEELKRKELTIITVDFDTFFRIKLEGAEKETHNNYIELLKKFNLRYADGSPMYTVENGYNYLINRNIEALAKHLLIEEQEAAYMINFAKRYKLEQAEFKKLFIKPNFERWHKMANMLINEFSISNDKITVIKYSHISKRVISVEHVKKQFTK